MEISLASYTRTNTASKFRSSHDSIHLRQTLLWWAPCQELPHHWMSLTSNSLAIECQGRHLHLEDAKGASTDQQLRCGPSAPCSWRRGTEVEQSLRNSEIRRQLSREGVSSTPSRLSETHDWLASIRAAMWSWQGCWGKRILVSSNSNNRTMAHTTLPLLHCPPPARQLSSPWHLGLKKHEISVIACVISFLEGFMCQCPECHLIKCI